MVLVVGGSFQGKLEYVKYKLAKQGILLSKEEILDGDCYAAPKRIKVLNGLHRMVFGCMKEDALSDAERITEKCQKRMDELLKICPNLVVICDEVGYGVIPLDKEERCYREAVGRLLCYLAQRAEQMERIVGGLPMIIKSADGKEQTVWNLSGSDTE